MATNAQLVLEPGPAVFDCDRVYRYLWTRRLSDGPNVCTFIGLNPSTADEMKSDPTVTRCMNYAKGWGYAVLVMANIFAFRSTDPKKMLKFKGDPVGNGNDQWLKWAAKHSDIIIAAWGTHGAHLNRGAVVLDMLVEKEGRTLYCLGKTKNGSPKHPLYLKADFKPEIYLGPGKW